MWWERLLQPFLMAISFVWVGIHKILLFIGMPSGPHFPWIISIILLTIVVRSAIVPLTIKQMKSARATQILQPHMLKLREKYKGKTDPESRRRQAEELSALNKKYGVNPLASCLPMLVQLPFILALYRTIMYIPSIKNGTFSLGDSLGPITKDIANEIDSTTVFGVSLSEQLMQTHGLGMVVFILLIAAMIVLQFIQMYTSMHRNMSLKLDPSNPMVKSQKLMIYGMPLMYVFLGFCFQMGLLIYMVTNAAFMCIQTLVFVHHLPNPDSHAYNALLAKRQERYRSWARPFFNEFDRNNGNLDVDHDEIERIVHEALTDVQKQAKRQKVASNFPDSMSKGDILRVYRNLANQDWTTLPDDVWMKGLHRAAASKEDKVERQAERQQPRRLSREQRMKERLNSGNDSEGASRDKEGDSSSMSHQEVPGGHGSTSAIGLSDEEVHRRRIERRQLRRKKGGRKPR